MDNVLADMLGRNVEAYVNDMINKLTTALTHYVRDLQNLFDTINIQLKTQSREVIIRRSS